MEGTDDVLTWVLTLARGFSLAACAGLRAWLPLLAAGLAARFTGLVELGEGFRFLSSTPALVTFGVASLVEIVGDKVPAVDHALDAAGTVLRPVAGALVSASVLYQVEDPLWALGIGLLVGAPTAAVPHAAKAATRGLSSSFTLGLANPVLSFLEDIAAFALAALALLLPIAIGAAVLLLGVMATVLVVRALRNQRAAAPG
jgi:hypothetical protein